MQCKAVSLSFDAVHSITESTGHKNFFRQIKVVSPVVQPNEYLAHNWFITLASCCSVSCSTSSGTLMAATLPVTATNTCCASPFCSDMLGQRSIASVRFCADSAEKSARLHWLDWLSLDYSVASKASSCARLFCRPTLVRASCCNHKYILIFNSQPAPSLNIQAYLGELPA